MCRQGIGRGRRAESETLFQLHVRDDNGPGEPPLVTLKAVCGPDDDGSPCLTVMLPDEDGARPEDRRGRVEWPGPVRRMRE